MDYIIRLVKGNDLEGLCNIRNNLDLFKSYLNRHENKEIYLVVAAHDQLILGFGVLKVQGILFPKLSDFYVKKDYRGKGIGSAMIRYREHIARDLGYTEMFVSVDPIENPKMIKLIQRHGYEAISTPYSKTATFYNVDGTTFEKTYTRIDLKKPLI